MKTIPAFGGTGVRNRTRRARTGTIQPPPKMFTPLPYTPGRGGALLLNYREGLLRLSVMALVIYAILPVGCVPRIADFQKALFVPLVIPGLDGFRLGRVAGHYAFAPNATADSGSGITRPFSAPSCWQAS